MRVFLTGATGFIGSAVAAQLAKAGHDLLVLAHSEASAKTLKSAGYLVIRGDMREPQQWKTEASKAEAIVHMAVLSRPIRTSRLWARQAAKCRPEARFPAQPRR